MVPGNYFEQKMLEEMNEHSFGNVDLEQFLTDKHRERFHYLAVFSSVATGEGTKQDQEMLIAKSNRDFGIVPKFFEVLPKKNVLPVQEEIEEEDLKETGPIELLFPEKEEEKNAFRNQKYMIKKSSFAVNGYKDSLFKTYVMAKSKTKKKEVFSWWMQGVYAYYKQFPWQKAKKRRASYKQLTQAGVVFFDSYENGLPTKEDVQYFWNNLSSYLSIKMKK